MVVAGGWYKRGGSVSRILEVMNLKEGNKSRIR